MQALRVLKSYRYELVAFLTGASVMILEIVGARLIAPVFGTSTYVWTAVIGVILASLALGYAVGGKLADRDKPTRFLSGIIFIAAVLVLAVGILQAATLKIIASWELDLRLSALLAATLLFGPPSALIGMVSPHLAKIRVTSLKTTGVSVGRLEAAGALGSIAGTFSCGYFLLGMFGSRSLIVAVVIVLLATSILASPVFRLKVYVLCGFAALLTGVVINYNPPGVLADIDSSYTRYRVLSSNLYGGNSTLLLTDHHGVQSAVSRTNPEQLVLAYAQQFQKAAASYPNLKRVLVIGGGAFTFPTHLVRTNPYVHVDVAEIDPLLDNLARQYFYLGSSPRLHIYSKDGRAYLNANTVKYDMIFMDAYSSLSPPFQLTTRETAERLSASLKADGIVVVNAIGSFAPDKNDYIRALLATYKTVFSHVSVHQLDGVQPTDNSSQNLMMIASNNAVQFKATAKTLRSPALPLPHDGLVLTDNYAPIERFTFE